VFFKTCVEMLKSVDRTTARRAFTKFWHRSAYWNLSKCAFLQYWPTVLTHTMWRIIRASASILSIPGWNSHRKMFGRKVVQKNEADFISLRFSQPDRTVWNCPELSRRAEIRRICLWYVLLTMHLGIIFVNNQLDAQFFFHVCLFLFCLCFGQPCAHHQEN